MRVALIAGLLLAVTAQFPSTRWPRSTPEEQGVDSRLLNAAMDYAIDPSSGATSTYCVSVHRNGVLIGEKYASGWVGGGMNDKTRNSVWSVTKAIVTTVIGMLELEGVLSTSDLLVKYIPELRSNANASLITIDNVLRHESGRYYDFITDFLYSQLQPSQTNFSLTLEQTSAPATVNQYNQMAFQLLERVVRVAIGDSIVNYAQRNLYDVLGMESRPFWQETSFLIPLSNDPLVYGGMWLTCQDLARFGTLWLHRGMWGTRRLFSEAFYTRALTSLSRPYGNSRRYHWGGPPNYRAEGLGVQIVVFNPEQNLVITRLGDMLNTGFSAGTYINQIMQAINTSDQGSWSLERDLIENQPPKEEMQMAAYLADLRAGKVQLPHLQPGVKLPQ